MWNLNCKLNHYEHQIARLVTFNDATFGAYLSRQLATNGANSTNSAKDGNNADRAKGVNVG